MFMLVVLSSFDLGLIVSMYVCVHIRIVIHAVYHTVI